MRVRLMMFLMLMTVPGLMGCALHEHRFNGCLLEDRVPCWTPAPTDTPDEQARAKECWRQWDEKTAPKRFTDTVRGSVLFLQMSSRVQHDFHLSLEGAARQYKYFGWAQWKDGSYGVVFQDTPPVVHIAGLVVSTATRGMVLEFETAYENDWHDHHKVVWEAGGKPDLEWYSIRSWCMDEPTINSAVFIMPTP